MNPPGGRGVRCEGGSPGSGNGRVTIGRPPRTTDVSHSFVPSGSLHAFKPTVAGKAHSGRDAVGSARFRCEPSKPATVASGGFFLFFRKVDGNLFLCSVSVWCVIVYKCWILEFGVCFGNVLWNFIRFSVFCVLEMNLNILCLWCVLV